MLAPAAIGLADRHRAGMIPGALAEVLEDVAAAGEARGCRPVHALAAHLDQRRGLAVHPARHEVAADAGQRLASPRAPWSRCCAGSRSRNRACGSRRGRTGGSGGCGKSLRRGGASSRSGKRRSRRRATSGASRRGDELADPGDQPVVVLVALADHALGLVAGIVVEILLELALDDAALLLDDEHLLLVADEGERAAPAPAARPCRPCRCRCRDGGRRASSSPSRRSASIRSRWPLPVVTKP